MGTYHSEYRRVALDIEEARDRSSQTHEMSQMRWWNQDDGHV